MLSDAPGPSETEISALMNLSLLVYCEHLGLIDSHCLKSIIIQFLSGVNFVLIIRFQSKLIPKYVVSIKFSLRTDILDFSFRKLLSVQNA